MKKDDIPEKIILDEEDGFKIVSAFSYNSEKFGIMFNYGDGGAPNLLVNKKGISVEVFNPSRKYFDKKGNKVHLDKKGNRVVEDLPLKKNNKLNYKKENHIKTNPINHKWDFGDYLSFIFLPIMAFGLLAKWFFLLPFVYMNEYGNRPWFLPATILYLIIMFLLLTFIFEMRGNNYY